jgi:hypothetical protein
MPTTFNTTDPKPGYVYDSALDTWFPLLGIAPGSSVVRWRFTAVGGETSVSGLDDLGATLSYNAGTEQVYLNGVLLVRTEDYLATTGTSVTGLTALAASDVIEVISFNATNVQITDALLETDINAKGDLIVGAAVDTATILASGTNGQVLKVNTATTSGLEWGAIDADITEVVAGTGLSGGGTSGAVTLTNTVATTLDAAGDILYASAADTPARLAIGTASQILAVNSGATAPEWVAAPASGGMTLISTTTLTGASVTLSSIPSTFNHLFIVLRNYCPATDAMPMYARFNGDSGASRYVTGAGFNNPAAYSAAQFNIWRTTQTNVEANCNQLCFGFVYDYLNTVTQKVFIGYGWGLDSDDVTHQNNAQTSLYNQKVAINSLTLLPQSGNFTSGTVLLYGVK